MKKILAIALLCAMTSAFAQTSGSTTGTSSAGSESTSSTTTGASTSGATVNVGCLTNCGSDSGTRDQTDLQITTINAEAAKEIARISRSQTIKNVPSVNGPPLVSSNDTCMGSASGSVNGPGFGIGIGKTYKDDNCVMLKNSRELWNMGMKAAAMALMCTDAANREALELTGYVCPQTKRDQDRKTSAAPTEQYTDPIVRARLGLPELTASATK